MKVFDLGIDALICVVGFGGIFLYDILDDIVMFLFCLVKACIGVERVLFEFFDLFGKTFLFEDCIIVFIL